jgi:prepilin signal peptidase PulO-like enzyme (type II secretory pathway)
VELTVALLFLAGALMYGPSGAAAAFDLLSAASVILVATDLDARVLPDEVTIGSLVLGVGVAGARDALSGSGPFRLQESDLLDSLLGALLGAGFLLLVRWAYLAVRGVEGLGLGDVKQLAMIGAYTGPSGVLVSLFFASLSGAVIGGVVIAARAARWRAARRRAAALDLPGAARIGAGLAVSGDGRLVAAGRRWTEVPESTAVGARPGTGEAGRRLVAFVRLARRRASRGLTSSTNRLMLEDDTFFRVLAARAEPVPGGGLLVLLGRADIPFGVFLAFGSLAAFVGGRAALALLFGALPIPAARLLP